MMVVVVVVIWPFVNIFSSITLSVSLSFYFFLPFSMSEISHSHFSAFSPAFHVFFEFIILYQTWLCTKILFIHAWNALCPIWWYGLSQLQFVPCICMELVYICLLFTHIFGRCLKVDFFGGGGVKEGGPLGLIGH